MAIIYSPWESTGNQTGGATSTVKLRISRGSIFLICTHGIKHNYPKQAHFIGGAPPTFVHWILLPMAPLSVQLIPKSELYVSKPHPRNFGNDANESENHNWTNSNWLESRFHFSFAEYYNPRSSNCSVIRALNDSLVQPHRRFGTHPHRNIEVITYIVHGQLTHEDSSGTSESLSRGSVQFITAGTGVMHSESNDEEKPLRFLQMWIDPSTHELAPRYGSYKQTQSNTMHHVVSNVGDALTSTPVEISQDIDMWTCELEEEHSIVHKIQQGRQGYLVCIEGITGGSGEVRIRPTETEETENGELAHFILFTTKAGPARSRPDMTPTNPSDTNPSDRPSWV